MSDLKSGKIVSVVGPVVDVEFDADALPDIMTALTITNPGIDDTADNLVVEVAQHLGDNVVRTIAMDVTDEQLVEQTAEPVVDPCRLDGHRRGPGEIE